MHQLWLCLAVYELSLNVYKDDGKWAYSAAEAGFHHHVKKDWIKLTDLGHQAVIRTDNSFGHVFTFLLQISPPQGFSPYEAAFDLNDPSASCLPPNYLSSTLFFNCSNPDCPKAGLSTLPSSKPPFSSFALLWMCCGDHAGMMKGFHYEMT